MSKYGVIFAACLAVVASAASAQSSVNHRSYFTPKAVPDARIQGQFCDSLGFVWNLSGAGMSGGVLNVTGSANICGESPASGTMALAKGLPLDVTATVTPGCYCNSFHEMQLTYDKASKLWVGTATAFGGCDGSASITLGKC